MAIYLRITVDSRRVEMATGLKYEPEKWNSASGRIVGAKAGGVSHSGAAVSISVFVSPFPNARKIK